MPIAAAGERASWRFIEFFTANIRNANTRRAYGRAVGDFFRWCSKQRSQKLEELNLTLVAAYVEQLGATHAKPSVKQHLAAVRMLFDWLIVGQVLPSNPASAVRGPAHVVKRGKTPVLSREEARELLDAIETDTVGGLRDRALIGVLVYSFARIGAAIGLKVEDYYPQGKRWWLRLHEKGGKRHEVPVHQTLEGYLDAYIDTAAIRDQKKGPLFRTLQRSTGRPLSLTPLSQPEAWQMIRRRSRAAGIRPLRPRVRAGSRRRALSPHLQLWASMGGALQLQSERHGRTSAGGVTVSRPVTGPGCSTA